MRADAAYVRRLEEPVDATVASLVAEDASTFPPPFMSSNPAGPCLLREVR